MPWEFCIYFDLHLFQFSILPNLSFLYFNASLLRHSHHAIHLKIISSLRLLWVVNNLHFLISRKQTNKNIFLFWKYPDINYINSWWYTNWISALSQTTVLLSTEYSCWFITNYTFVMCACAPFYVCVYVCRNVLFQNNLTLKKNNFKELIFGILLYDISILRYS